MKLLAEIGIVPIDRVLREAIDLLERSFPGRVRGYYLVGSYAVGRAIWTSDIDMVALFKGRLDPDEKAEFARIIDACRATCAYPLDVNSDEEERLYRAGAARFQHASLLLYGEDVRAALPLKPIEAYTRDEMHLPYRLSARARGQPEALVFPLGFPDAAGEFYGYDRRRLRIPDGTVRPCTKELVLIVACAATALLALDPRQYVRHKSELPALYRRWIGGEWAETVEQIYARCREQWAYLIPEDAADRRLLRRLCERALAFENYFLARYKEFLLDDLRHADETYRLWAARRLGQIVYPDAAVAAALREASEDKNAEVRAAAAESLLRYEPFTNT